MFQPVNTMLVHFCCSFRRSVSFGCGVRCANPKLKQQQKVVLWKDWLCARKKLAPLLDNKLVVLGKSGTDFGNRCHPLGGNMPLILGHRQPILGNRPPIWGKFATDWGKSATDFGKICRVFGEKGVAFIQKCHAYCKK